MTTTNVEEVPFERQQDCVAVVTGAKELGLSASDIVAMTRQTGGLFNFLLRVETTRGTYYFKQYLDGVPNATFKPPEIPASRRCALAYEVQREATEANAESGDVVPRIVHYDTARNAFLMEPANGESTLIELLSTGTIPDVAVTQLPRALGRLHQRTWGKYSTSSLYANTEFRDFKLKIQYDDIASQLTPEEAVIVMDTKRRYQDRTMCVTHGDPNSRNISVGGGVMGLYDFEQSHLGAPAYDLAYILCEMFIAMEYFGRRPEHIDAIKRFLDSYFEVFDAETREDVERETTAHLAVQMIYRFWGPSRASWTFYIPEPDKEHIVATSREMLSDRPVPVSALLGPELQRSSDPISL